jgi:hypothetical protein
MNRIFNGIISIIQRLQPPNWTIIKETNIEGCKIINYFYNGKRYKYVGFMLPRSVTKGFVVPLKHVTWNDKDVTKYVLQYAGPRHDFFNEPIPLKFMFYTITHVSWKPETHIRDGKIGVIFRRHLYIKPQKGVLKITNIFNQSYSVSSG